MNIDVDGFVLVVKVDVQKWLCKMHRQNILVAFCFLHCPSNNITLTITIIINIFLVCFGRKCFWHRNNMKQWPWELLTLQETMLRVIESSVLRRSSFNDSKSWRTWRWSSPRRTLSAKHLGDEKHEHTVSSVSFCLFLPFYAGLGLLTPAVQCVTAFSILLFWCSYISIDNIGSKSPTPSFMAFAVPRPIENPRRRTMKRNEPGRRCRAKWCDLEGRKTIWGQKKYLAIWLWGKISWFFRGGWYPIVVFVKLIKS